MHALEVRFASLRWSDVQDFAGFVEGQAAGGESVGCRRVVLHGGGIFLRGRGLLVGFGEGTAKDARASNEYLRHDSIGLTE